jgi:truncated hemoglobin YjbI
MIKRPKEAAANEQLWLPKFEPDRLLRSEPNEAEEALIETHIAPYASDFYEQVRAQRGIKPFHGAPPSPDRFLKYLKIIVRTYVQNRDDEPAYDHAKARKTLKKLKEAWVQLSARAELHTHLREVFIEEMMRASHSSASRLTDEWTVRAADLGTSFDGFPKAIDTILGQVSQMGRKPQNSAKVLVIDLAFHWHYLAGVPPTYMHGDTSKNTPFRELLRIINNQVLPPKHRSENDFDAYGAVAVDIAKKKIGKIDAEAARFREAEAERIRKGPS